MNYEFTLNTDAPQTEVTRRENSEAVPGRSGTARAHLLTVIKAGTVTKVFAQEGNNSLRTINRFLLQYHNFRNLFARQ